MTRRVVEIGAPAICAALLIGMALADPLRVDEAAAAPFHARVRQAAAQLPLDIGAWHGKDEAIEPDAIKLLKPNVMISRLYVNVAASEGAQLLIVQCLDSRDMVGHYPENCYTSAGCSIETSRRRMWDMPDGSRIEGMEYTIQRPGPAAAAFVVRDFFVLPDGTITADMQTVGRAAHRLKHAAYGAAQIQLVCDAQMSVPRRDAMFQWLVGCPQMMTLIQVMKSGGMP